MRNTPPKNENEWHNRASKTRWKKREKKKQQRKWSESKRERNGRKNDKTDVTERHMHTKRSVSTLTQVSTQRTHTVGLQVFHHLTNKKCT